MGPDRNRGKPKTAAFWGNTLTLNELESNANMIRGADD